MGAWWISGEANMLTSPGLGVKCMSGAYMFSLYCRGFLQAPGSSQPCRISGRKNGCMDRYKYSQIQYSQFLNKTCFFQPPYRTFYRI